ncbi:Protein NLP2 [Platanthera zijinensis]|uniref:Protein NLP2 n=1 Tax=Platanthera zijinensis TaxID=2320716 RepID=A0AAP0BSI3_9ASPA
MEDHSSHRVIQANQAHTDGFMAIDYGAGSPMSEDLTLLGLFNFDGLIEPSSPLPADLAFSNNSSLHPLPGNYASLTFPDDLEQARDSIQEDERSSDRGCSRFISDSQLDYYLTASVVPKSIGGFTFSDRMTRALSLLKESSGGNCLAQVWMPGKHGDSYMLSTCEQPFLLDQVLEGYREISRVFTFSATETAGMFPGVPGRVFISGLPEWASNVIYYTKLEYLRVDYAVTHDVRGSLAVPIFDFNNSKCCAVLEFVTTQEKPNFNIELENVCRALKAVDLRTTKAHPYHQNLTKDQKSALSEILDVLRTVCHAYMLPLALTWMPISSDSENVEDDGKTAIFETKRFSKEIILCIQESACYVNDPQMHGFLQACTNHYLTNGQGVAGKAFLSQHPIFSSDVKGYDIGEYPLVHHARKFGLQAAVAIWLKSTFTGDDDFVLEFFLPVNCKGCAEQQLLLDNLSVSMQKICRSLRISLDAGAAGPKVTEAGTKNMEGANNQSSEITAKNSQKMSNRSLHMSDGNKELADVSSNCQNMDFHEQVKCSSLEPTVKKRAVKHISLNVLQRYFAGNLKSAAKSLGVCPTTLKRICRQHGISRWPSRKIKKVNHSLKKIQRVINSVQGVEGTFKYDPKTGCLVTDVTPENDSISFSSSPLREEQILHENLGLSNDKNTGQCVKVNSKTNEVDLQLKSMHEDSPEEKDDTDFKIDGHLSVSSASDFSNESASSSQILKESSKNESFFTGKGAVYVVKAAYKDDIVRFKLSPSMACLQLYEEIGKRFKLCTGTFQLKYMDDEEEWIMLTNDSDLQECIEVLESMASQCIKLQVRDSPF